MNKRAWVLISLFLSFSAALLSAQGDRYFILGGKEGEGQLGSIGQIKEGPDGNIYVFDRSDAFIKVYSPNGKYLRKIGGQGQGPGEFQRVDGARFGFLSDGKLYFTEYFRGHPWITIMDPSGKFEKALHPQIKGEYGVSVSSPLREGGLLLELGLGGSAEAKEDYFLYRSPEALVRIDSEGKVISRIIQKNDFTRISSVADGADLGLPFVPAFAWTLFSENSIIFSDGLSKILKVYDLNGRPTSEITTSLPEPDKVRSKDLDEWRKSIEGSFANSAQKAWFNRFGRVIEKYRTSVYDRKPILESISLTPEGNLLINGAWKRSQNVTQWLIDKRGKTLAEISFGGSGLTIARDFILFSASDADENELAYCVRRTGKEAEDFSKLANLRIEN